MKNENDELIETVDEDGNKVTFELLDVVTVDDVELAVLCLLGILDCVVWYLHFKRLAVIGFSFG